MRVIAAIVLGLLLSVPTVSQVVTTSYTYTLPQIVDGQFSDGSYYRSTINLLLGYSNVNASCTITPVGFALGLDGVAVTTQTAISVPANGWYVGRTDGTQSFQSGFVSVTCNTALRQVFAMISSYSPIGTKLGEATIDGVLSPYSVWWLMVDQRQGARVGVAIANLSDSAVPITWSFFPMNRTLAAGTPSQKADVNIPGRKNVAHFVDEILPGLPPDSVGVLKLVGPASLATSFTAAGLRFTGAVFSTLRALDPGGGICP